MDIWRKGTRTVYRFGEERESRFTGWMKNENNIG